MKNKKENNDAFIFEKRSGRVVGVGLTTLDALRESGRIGFYQRRPGCKVQFTQTHIDRYLEQVEQAPRSTVRRKM